MYNQDNIKKAVNEFVEGCISRFGQDLVSVILFGSVARRTAKKYSDIDILVVIDELPKRRLDREEVVADIILGVLKKYHIRISPMLLESTELSTKNLNPLIYGILTGYTVLYDPQNFWSKFLTKIKPIILKNKPVYIEGKKRWQMAHAI